jgi:Fe-S-cluster containining protein
MSYPTPYRRTVCACETCVDFCKRPAHLIPADIKRIGEFLVKEGRVDVAADASQFLRASNRTKVGILTSRGLEIVTLPTITPRVENGACVFLKDNRCTIHAVAPFGCAFFDAHMPNDEANDRVKWSLREIARDDAYKSFRALLEETQRKEATSD